MNRQPLMTLSSHGRPCRRARYHRAMVSRLITTLAVVYLAVLVLPACQPVPDYRNILTSVVSSISREPAIRVRIARGTSNVKITGPSQLYISPLKNSSSDKRWLFATPVTITHQADGFVIRSSQSPALVWKQSALKVEVEANDIIHVDQTGYAGWIALHATKHTGNDRSQFDVINHLPLESYLPGVLHKELYKNWSPATFRAQAIAARSYAIVQGAANRSKYFDVESTTASQAYAGAGAHNRARRAVRDTRGLVLTYRNRVLPAYYSSSCGGVGQDASVAFPYGQNIRPLRGYNHGAWCAKSTRFRWGPVTRSRLHLQQRLAAWGHTNRHAIANLKTIATITVSSRNAVSRPARFTVTDITGQSYGLPAESFRFACNYQAPSVQRLSDAARLKSSDVDVHLNGDMILITGRGYGHGVGLCQWGAQALARAGHQEYTILSFYYPGAGVTKAY